MIESGRNSKLREKKYLILLSVYLSAFIIFGMTESGHKRDTSLCKYITWSFTTGNVVLDIPGVKLRFLSIKYEES